jgi:hypothetical protein
VGDIVVSTFVTLDGAVQGPGGPEEDPSGGFTHGGRLVGKSSATGLVIATDERADEIRSGSFAAAGSGPR